MSERKINLKNFIERCKLVQPYGGANSSIELYSEAGIKIAMIEFGKQLLELAAENAKVGMEYRDEDISFHTIVNKQSILSTIKQIE